MPDPKKKKARKATKSEKEQIKAGKRYLKGKKDKNPRASQKITGQYNPTVSRPGKRQGVVNPNAASPTTRRIGIRQEEKRQSTLTETRGGRKLVAKEAKLIEQGKIKGQPVFGGGHTFKNSDVDRMKKRGNFGG